MSAVARYVSLEKARCRLAHRGVCSRWRERGDVAKMASSCAAGSFNAGHRRRLLCWRRRHGVGYMQLK